MVVWTDRVGYNRVAGVLYTLMEHNDVSIFNNGEELMSMKFGNINFDFKFDDQW